jgi:hypothetical protein
VKLARPGGHDLDDAVVDELLPLRVGERMERDRVDLSRSTFWPPISTGSVGRLSTSSADQPADRAGRDRHSGRADVQAGREVLWFGHSMGAALGYYLPSVHPAWKFKLITTVDPMNWASNINCGEWQKAPPHPGWWEAKGSFDRWVDIRARIQTRLRQRPDSAAI